VLNDQQNSPDKRWKDPAFLESWKQERRERLETAWALRAPLFSGLALTSLPHVSIREDVLKSLREQQEPNETLSQRARRLEKTTHRPKENRTSSYRVPALLVRQDDGTFEVSPWASRADAEQLQQAQSMIGLGLPKKAQRVLACSLLGGEVICRSGHKFSVKYACGSRYCRMCGPKAAARLFAKYCDPLLRVAAELLRCNRADCQECEHSRHDKSVPHWPPIRKIKPKNVIAKLDFTLKNTGKADSERVKFLNRCIRRFFRAVEKRFSIARSQYGVLWCDELGGNNTNVHAHAVYVGPWLPQEKKQLSKLWAEITKDGSFIVSIKYAKSFPAALMHALKYSAKFVYSSTPERRAQLEKIFHRTRRVHTLAAFYNPKVHLDSQETFSVQKLRCPICNEQVSEPNGWRPMAELEAKGLRDIRELHHQKRRDLVLGDQMGSSG
jgi:hypothetical protein